MTRCSKRGCNRKSGLTNGRCRTHQLPSTSSPPKSPASTETVGNAKSSLDELSKLVKQLQDENLSLNNQFDELQSAMLQQKVVNKKLVEENIALRQESNTLRAKINTANYMSDSVEQYTRRENIRIHDVEEKDNEKDSDVMKEIIDRANYALSKSQYYSDTRVEESDIQRAHRVGEKKVQAPGSNTPPKPRKIICRFKSWALRQKVIKSKKALKGSPKFNGSFITEDLTQYKAKLLWYAKNHCDGKFVKCHTRNGEVKAQLKSDQNLNHDDENQGQEKINWITIKSPEDFFKHGVEVDYKLLNDKYVRFEILDQLDIENRKNELNQLINAITLKT